MDSAVPLLIPLDTPGQFGEESVGGKAAKLAELAGAGLVVPKGFCLTTSAYEVFVEDAGITPAIRMELGRKPMGEMRWEEIWDAALRIRGLFLAHPLNDKLRGAVSSGYSQFDETVSLAVRSSAIGEDSAGRSFAGLHESIIGVRGLQALEDAVRLVWASLWSDAALLYRRELGLDPARSRMAVLVQQMVDSDRSGVAFARDPRDTRREHAIIESVPGPCSLLVDGLVDPDRWEIDRKTGKVIVWLPGEREEASGDGPLLEPCDLERVLETLLAVEKLFGWSPDMEWTGRSDLLTVLQARPITTATTDEKDERSWYLTLRPGDAQLKELRSRVAEQRIPALESEGDALAAEELDRLDDRQLAAAIEYRAEAVSKWKKIYWDEFIPFAHGVRRLATYYNDAVKPEDPYEFVGLLRDQPLLAAQRNRAIVTLARQLRSNASLRSCIEQLVGDRTGSLAWPSIRDQLLRSAGGEDFIRAFEDLSERFLDIAYDHGRMHDQFEPLLRNLVELAQGRDQLGANDRCSGVWAAELERRLLDAVGTERHDEAIEVVETGRVSWKLRDDDNLLIARLESQLLRAIGVAEQRLRPLGRVLGEGSADDSHAEPMVRALRDRSATSIRIEPKAQTPETTRASTGESPRQLIGQPASPGVATGSVRCLHGSKDLGMFRHGEVMVCDAIQPTMTHLVPLACAIVERRGGMLIHGAIIARELGIPCVNGVRNAAEILRNGDLVTVDGHLGIVAVGTPELDLEFGLVK